ncbi:MAG: transaldolase [Bauldia sp.]|nr:transaldolase [Bauldia sp.]MCW5717544.1 transaldolase [Bauldia sp.]
MAMMEGDGLPDGITQLRAAGQLVWLDDLGRHLLDTGGLARHIRKGVTGVTSNPAIFAEAIRSSAYDETIRRLSGEGLPPAAIAERVVLEDVGRAADLLRAVHDETAGADGFVSIEVAPALAHDVDGTVAEAHRLWDALARPNVMIKVPGTEAGVEALRRLIGDGINVNVTLLFSPRRYAAVLEAHAAALDERIAGGATSLPASVASFFLSRIDAAIDPVLDARGGPWALPLRGLAAIASARAAYETLTDFLASDRWRVLAAHGASVQRLLWASTSTKNPAYAPTKYVEPLALPNTINTMSRQTLAAALAIGGPRVVEEFPTLEALSGKLAELDIDTADVARRLEAEGIAKFIAAQEALEAAVAARLAPAPAPPG